ncbi:hypothetical protein ACHAW6_011239 [Cyclotella cf. meneghiniana]
MTPKNPRCHILKVALASRIALLLAMSLSCAILPDFNPGDDVLRFDLRLSRKLHSSRQALDYNGYCFCQQGHACDPYVSSRRRKIGFDKESDHCADAGFGRQSTLNRKRTRFAWLDILYRFILPPVTKWDSARFLMLAVDPWARYPVAWDEGESFQNDTSVNHIHLHDEMTCNSSDSISTISSVQKQQDELRFYSSEQSHAFMPLFPLCIRYVAKALMILLPQKILPLSFEGTAALSAMIINILAFLIAAVALYDLTLYLMKVEIFVTEGTHKIVPISNGENYKANESTDDYQVHQSICNTVATLFCINPAGVFFTAAYSESMFAMFIFSGYAIAARGQYFRCKALHSNQHESLNRYQFVWAKFYPIPTNVLWCLASYTRFNGMLASSIWWLLLGLGKICFRVNNRSIFRETSSNRKVVTRFAIVSFDCMFDLLYHGFLGFVVASPVMYHDWRGYSFHCTQASSVDTRYVPQWCNYVNNHFFPLKGSSLYAYVQQKHWNVGFFRYYEIKQIPNFILALPVLVLSTCAVVRWIQDSLRRHKVRMADSFSSTFVCVCQWAIEALGASAIDVKTKKYAVKESSVLGEAESLRFLLGSSSLSYYAMLFEFVLVGSFLAHVQISTRLISSSCPAFYWFIVVFFLRDNSKSQVKAHSKQAYQKEHRRNNVSLELMLCFYFALYNLLGVIMHVNFLPWT